MTDYLVHHGIKGQRWGVRNGPPYPLSSAKHQRVVSKGDAKTPIGGTATRDGGDAELDPIESLAIQLSVYALVYFTMVGVAKVSEKLDRKKCLKNLDALYQKRTFRHLRDVPRLSKPTTPEESIKLTNPDFPNPGSVQNCTFCTAALAMREKGYDVVAAKTDIPMYTDDLYKRCFNAKMTNTKAKTPQQLIGELEKAGPGAYGHLGVRWALGGGHSIFWKNDGGRIRIYDGQSGEEYDISDPKNSKLFNNIVVKSSQWCRLDNCQPTEMVLAMLERRR